MSPCAMSGSVIMSQDLSKNIQEGELTDNVHDVAEVVAGYLDCMEEAVRYLVEVESYPETHPAVQGLRAHLAEYQRQLVTQALQTCQKAGS